MDYISEKSLFSSLQYFLGKDVWLSLSKSRRLAIVELVEQHAFRLIPGNYGCAIPDMKDIEKMAYHKMLEIERTEFLAILKNDMREFPGYNPLNYGSHANIFNKLHKRMTELLIGLKNMKFDHPELEKRRLTIVEAIENRLCIPSDDYDLYVISFVVPGIMPEEDRAKIEEWAKT